MALKIWQPNTRQLKWGQTTQTWVETATALKTSKNNSKINTDRNTGAPNENIVQNHLNIVLLNVF